MSERPEAGPNAAQYEYWNEQAGPTWVEMSDRLDATIAPFGRMAIERAAPRPGERVLDVGCGCGQTTLELAGHVGSEGRVTGLDLSAPMLALARERAGEAGAANARFEQADAQTAPLDPGGVDLVYSRFGVMFFADPVAAFANLRAALAPGGRVVFVCWQELARNPWMLVPVMAVGKHVPLPAPPEPGAPGPFSLADGERLRGILEGAGFADVSLDPVTTQLRLGGGGSLDEVVEFVPRGLARIAALIEEAGPDTRAAAIASIRDALAPYETPDGVQLEANAWVVSAR